MDIVSIYIIPIGATLGALSWFWIMKRDELMEEVNLGGDVLQDVGQGDEEQGGPGAHVQPVGEAGGDDH